MTIKIISTFIGENKSLGYLNGKIYNLEIKTLTTGRIQIRDLNRNNGTCQYGNIVKFLENWTNIVNT